MLCGVTAGDGPPPRTEPKPNGAYNEQRRVLSFTSLPDCDRTHWLLCFKQYGYEWSSTPTSPPGSCCPNRQAIAWREDPRSPIAGVIASAYTSVTTPARPRRWGDSAGASSPSAGRWSHWGRDAKRAGVRDSDSADIPRARDPFCHANCRPPSQFEIAEELVMEVFSLARSGYQKVRTATKGDQRCTSVVAYSFSSSTSC